MRKKAVKNQVMKKFPMIADTIFYTAASWFAAVGILRWLRAPTAICFAAATLIACSVGGIAFFLLYRRGAKRFLGKKKQEQLQALMLHLTLESDDNIKELLEKAFSADGRDIAKAETLVVDDKPLIPLFTMQPLSADTVALLLKQYKRQPFLLACNRLSPEAERLLASFAREWMDGEEVYDLLSRTQTIPGCMICGEIERKNLRSRLQRMVSKKNAYPFFVSGAGLLVMSLFVLFPAYYLISGCLLLLASVLTRAFGHA